MPHTTTTRTPSIQKLLLDYLHHYNSNMRLHSAAVLWIATSSIRCAMAGVQLHPCPPQETLSPTTTELNTSIPPETLTPNTTIEWNATIPPETLSPSDRNTTDVCQFEHDSLNLCLDSHNADAACHKCIVGAENLLYEASDTCDTLITRACDYLSKPACSSCPIVECKLQLEVFLGCRMKSTGILDCDEFDCPAQDELQGAPPCQSGFMCVLSNIIQSIVAWIIAMFGGGAA